MHIAALQERGESRDCGTLGGGKERGEPLFDPPLQAADEAGSARWKKISRDISNT
jgi:hypothetical protein